MCTNINGVSAALTWRDEQGLALLQGAFVALVHLVGKEHLAVIGWRPPALVQRQVSRCGLDKEEDLLSLWAQTDFPSSSSSVDSPRVSIMRVTDLQDVVPHGGAAALDVEVCVTVFDTDQTVFGDFWLSEQRIVRPVVFHPRQSPHNLRTLHYAVHPDKQKGAISTTSYTRLNFAIRQRAGTWRQRTPGWWRLTLSSCLCCSNSPQTLSASSCCRSVWWRPPRPRWHRDLRRTRRRWYQLEEKRTAF